MKKKRTLEERRRTLLRKAKTEATCSTGIGGVEKKSQRAPKPITLPKLKCLGEVEP